MNRAYIKLLQKRIEDLDAKNYNLAVWQNVTTLLLSRIFGAGNNYTKEVEGLKVEHSSWALRDATADYNPKETSKQLGREILELAIAELEFSNQADSTRNAVIRMLQNRSEKLAEAITQQDATALLALLKKEGKEYLAGLLVKLVVDKPTSAVGDAK